MIDLISVHVGEVRFYVDGPLSEAEGTLIVPVWYFEGLWGHPILL